MKKLRFILGLLLAIMVVPMAFAAGEVNIGKCTDATGNNCKLMITDVDVKVDSKSDKNLEDGDSISEEAKPGSKVKFSIELYNNFTDDEDVDIEDVTVTVTIEGIDDGDDLEEESKSFDVKADDNENIDIEFEIPLEVDEDDFDVVITVEGDTDKNGSQESEMRLTLEVQKENDELRFLSNTLTPSEVKCGRNAQMSTSVINTGSDEQEDAILEITNEELAISLKETFDVSEDAFDDDSKFTKTFTFAVPEDADPGVYSIISKVTYNTGRTSKTESADLTVSECEVSSKDKETDTSDTTDEGAQDSNVVVVTPPTNQDVGNLVTAGAVTAPQLTEDEGSVFESQSFLVALIVGEVLLVLVAILLVVAVARRKRKD